MLETCYTRWSTVTKSAKLVVIDKMLFLAEEYHLRRRDGIGRCAECLNGLASPAAQLKNNQQSKFWRKRGTLGVNPGKSQSQMRWNVKLRRIDNKRNWNWHSLSMGAVDTGMSLTSMCGCPKRYSPTFHHIFSCYLIKAVGRQMMGRYTLWQRGSKKRQASKSVCLVLTQSDIMKRTLLNSTSC